MRLMLIASAALAFANVAHAQNQSCRAEVGARAAQQLVDRCTDISPATHPPCNASNPCEMIRDEIARGCRYARATPGSAPSWCARD